MESKYQPQRWALTQDQIDSLVKVVESWVPLATGTTADIAMMHRDYAIALLLIYTGVTINEIRMLNNDDYTFDGAGKRCLVIGSRHRTILLTRETNQTISRWLIMRKLVFGSMHNNALFTNRRTERINAASIKQVLSRMRMSSAIPFTTFSLRHTFIKRMIEAGRTELEISQMLSRPSRAIIEMYGQTDYTAPMVTLPASRFTSPASAHPSF